MRQVVKNVKNGKEMTFVCSACDSIVDIIFVPTGKNYEPDWYKIPEKCSCGERLISRQPIIDEYDDKNCDDDGGSGNEDDVDNGIDNHRNTCKTIDKNVGVGNIHDKYNICMRDLERAMSLNYFHMRLNSLKRSSFKIPENIDALKLECINRNISHIESMTWLSDNGDDEDGGMNMYGMLNNLRQIHGELSNKLERRY